MGKKIALIDKNYIFMLFQIYLLIIIEYIYLYYINKFIYKFKMKSIFLYTF